MNKMKRYSLLWSMLVVLLWYACSDKEDHLEPSHQDRNWMEIQDEPGELNQWRFRLYKEYGISVFVNDTIGSEQRGYDAYGQPIIYHEMLWPGYTITGNAGFVFALSSDTVGMIRAVKMIYDWVAPNLFKSIKYRPASYLLCDKMYSLSYSYGDTICRNFDIKPALKTTTLSIAEVKDMDQEELKDFAARIVEAVSSEDVLSYFEEELNGFYEISKEGLEEDPCRVTTTYSNTFVLPDGWKEEKLYSTGGFLHEQARQYIWNDHSGKKVNFRTPQKREDAGNYVGAVMVYSESEFEQVYGQYDKMMRKFRFMRDIVARFKSEVLKE